MSLPTPPSGILDKDRPWYRGKISDAQWDRLKAKLTGGTDAGGTSYSKFIQCSSAEADKIISNMKKDPRGYPQMYMPGGGESYQIMIDFYQWLKDSYLGDEPKEEEIPVEVEVVEVEQKTVDEPIVVKIEAPFEPTPTQPLSAPKTLRLPRRSGLIFRQPARKKKSAAERMAEAFDDRLDDLIDSIKNPPEPAQPKQRKQKETLVKIKRSLKPAKFTDRKGTKGPNFFQNSSLFTFNKVKDALGRAAQLRREAAAQGMPAQEKGFYATRALGLEFGGDAVARTRGMFSSSPDATLDPSLTKQQRYAAGIFGARTIRPPKESGVAKDIDRQVDELAKKLDAVIDTKKITPESAELQKTLNQLKEKLSAGNKLQSDINASKKKLLSLEAKEADRAQARAEEAETDRTEDLSDFEDMDPGKKSGAKDGDGEGGGLDIDWKKIKWGKWLRRLKNPMKFGRALFRLGRMKVGGAIKGAKVLGAKVLGGAKGLVAGGAAATAAIVGGAGLAASAIGEGFFQLTKKGGAGEQARDYLKKKGEEVGGPMGALIGGMGNLAGISNEATKVTGNILDVVGAPFRYAIEGIRYPFLNEEDREKQAANLAKFDARIRENIRGGLNRIDVMNVVPDEKGGFGNIYGNDDAQKEMMEKMSEGGTIPKFQAVGGARLTGDLPTAGPKVMAGEAGDEMVITPQNNPLQSLAPMIVAMREVTKRAGTWADPVENMVRQVTDPIAKKIGLPTLPTTIDIGQNIPSGNQGEQKDTKKKKKGGLLDKLMNFVTGAGPAAAAGIPFSGDVNMGGGAGTTTAGAVYNYLLSKGMSENHAKGLVANISRESGFKLGAHGDKGIGGSFGLFQWNMAAGRGGPMMAAVPDWKTNWKGQIDYALQEFTGPDYFKRNFATAGEAAHWWMANWEIPAASIQAKYTPAYYEGMINKMGLHQGMPVTPPQTAAANPPAAPSTPASSSSGNRQMGRSAAKRRQEAAASQPAQQPVAPVNPQPPAPTSTVVLPLLQQRQPQQSSAAAIQPIPMTDDGKVDFMEMARRQRLAAS